MPHQPLIAFSAGDGRRLWSAPAREGYNSPVDLLVTGWLVWSGDLVSARDPGITQARDLATGEVRQTRPNDQEFYAIGMGHHRCYRNKATDRYLITGRAGAEFVGEHPVQVPFAVAEPPRDTADAIAFDDTVGDQSHRPGDHVLAHVPFRRAG